MSNRTVALVPMKGHSERVPEKNYRLFSGQPLYHHIMGSLTECPEIDEIVVNTDSEVIANGMAEAFPEVRVLERPELLQGDEVPMNDILRYDVSQVEGDFYLQTHSTNPLLKATTISEALNQMANQWPTYDSLFSVTRMQTRLWDQLARPINHNPSILLRTQDLPPTYEENSNMYVFTRDVLEEHHNRIGKRPFMFEMDPLEAWDIDEELDFRIAEFLHQEGAFE